MGGPDLRKEHQADNLLFFLGSSTAGVAFLPMHSGVSPAVILLALLRVLQEAALGGAWDGLASLPVSDAPSEQRGWYAMIPQLGAPIGFATASALFAFSLATFRARIF